MLFLLDILPKFIQFCDYVNKNTNRLLYFCHHQRAILTSTETKLSRLSKKKKNGQTTLSEGWLTWLYKLRCLAHSQACTLILDSYFSSLDLYIKVRSWFLDQNQLTTSFLYLGAVDWYRTFEPMFKMDRYQLRVVTPAFDFATQSLRGFLFIHYVFDACVWKFMQGQNYFIQKILKGPNCLWNLFKFI